MLKRIMIFVCIIVLCVSMALPAFGIGSTGGADSVFAYMQFDTVQLLGGMYANATANWPYNEFCGDAAFISVDDDRSGDTFLSGYVTGTREDIKGSFLGYDATGIILRAESLYYDGEHSVEIMGDQDETLFTRAIVSFNYVKLVKNAMGNVTVDSRYIHYDTDSDKWFYHGQYSVNIGDLLDDAYSKLLPGGLPTDDGIVLLTDVEIRLYFESPIYNEGLYVYVPGAPDSYPYDMSDWIVRFGDHLEGSGEMFDWVIDTLGSFLSFEIAPGFSIDNLLFLFITVGLVLWFIKLLS